MDERTAPAREVTPRAIVAAMALGLLALAWAAMAGRSAAQSGTLVRIEPPGGHFAVGEIITVTVRVEEVTNLYGVDVRLAFDPARLEVVEGAALPATELLSPPWLIFLNQVNNTAGTVWYVVTLVNPNVPVSGSGALFSFHFRTRAPGPGAAAIDQLTLSDIDGGLIPAGTAGGTFWVGHSALLPLVFGSFSGAGGVETGAHEGKDR